MKIILTAFNNKLRSDIIEIMDETHGHSIKYILPVKRKCYEPDSSGCEFKPDELEKEFIFDFTNRYVIVNNESVAVYELIAD